MQTNNTKTKPNQREKWHSLLSLCMMMEVSSYSVTTTSSTIEQQISHITTQQHNFISRSSNSSSNSSNSAAARNFKIETECPNASSLYESAMNSTTAIATYTENKNSKNMFMSFPNNGDGTKSIQMMLKNAETALDDFKKQTTKYSQYASALYETSLQMLEQVQGQWIKCKKIVEALDATTTTKGAATTTAAVLALEEFHNELNQYLETNNVIWDRLLECALVLCETIEEQYQQKVKKMDEIIRKDACGKKRHRFVWMAVHSPDQTYARKVYGQKLRFEFRDASLEYLRLSDYFNKLGLCHERTQNEIDNLEEWIEAKKQKHSMGHHKSSFSSIKSSNNTKK